MYMFKSFIYMYMNKQLEYKNDSVVFPFYALQNSGTWCTVSEVKKNSGRKKVQVSHKTFRPLTRGTVQTSTKNVNVDNFYLSQYYEGRKSNLHQEFGTLVFNRVYLSLDLIAPL